MAIFSDGFESGDFSAWTSTTGSPTVQNSIKHHDTYAMRVAGSNVGSSDYASKSITFTEVNPRYLRFYMYFDALGDEDYTGALCGIYWYGSCLGGCILRWDGSKNVLTLVYSDNSGNDGATALQEHTWYCIEVVQYGGTGDGYVKIYLNGILEAENTGLTETNTPLSVRVGILHDYKGAIICFDCVVVADAYIGPEDAGGPTVKKGSSLVNTMTEMLNSKMLFSACNRFPKLVPRRF